MPTLRLGELLVKQAKLMPAQLRQGLKLQQQLGGRLGTNLLEAGLVREDALLTALGEQRSTRTAGRVDLEGIPASVLRQLPAKLASRYQLVPYQLQGKTLFVASMNIGDALIEDEIRMLTGYMVRTTLALELRVREALLRYYRIPSQARFQVLARRLAEGGIKPSTRAPGKGPKTPSAGLAVSSSGPALVSATPPPTPKVSAPPPPSAADKALRPAPPDKAAAKPVAKATAEPTEEPTPEALFIELDAEDEALLRAARSTPAEPSAGASEAGGEATTSPDAASPESSFAELLADGADEPTVELRTEEVGATVAPTVVSEGETEVSPLLFTGEVEPEIDLRDPALSLEERLDLAAMGLQKAEIRDEIADVLLDFCAPYLERRMLLIHRQEKIVGWRGEGDRVDREAVRSISIGDKEPSVFLSVSQPSGFWLAPLPPLEPNQRLIAGLGGEGPKDCLILPVVLRSKVVCFLYGDNRAKGVAGIPVAELRRLVAKAGIAFEVYILKNKIRLA